MIDPPNGWQYGFPKVLPKDVVDVKGWLIENGYPKSVIQKLGDTFTYRIIETFKTKKNGRNNKKQF